MKELEYKEKLFEKYVSLHTIHIAPVKNLDTFKRCFQSFNDFYGRFLPVDFNAKIIDIACGTGEVVYWLNQKGYRNVEGIDISSENVQIANSLGIKNIKQADLRSYLTDKNEYYDVILAIDIIEHFNKKEIVEILNLICKALKSEGKLIIKTPNAEGIFGSRYRYFDFTHEIAFTEWSLKQVLSLAGFRKTYFKEAITGSHGVRSTIKFILWHAIKLLLNMYIFIETGEKAKYLSQNIICIARK